MELKFILKKVFGAKAASREIEELAEMFLGPYIKAMENEEISLKNGVDSFFNTDTREMFFVKASKRFVILGRHVSHNEAVSATLGQRTVDKGKRMLVVYDKVDETYKAEFRSGRRFDEFVMTATEYKNVERYLERI